MIIRNESKRNVLSEIVFSQSFSIHYKPNINLFSEPENVMKKLISGICGDEKENKLNYLKAFVEFSKKINGDFGSIGYHVREVLIW